MPAVCVSIHDSFISAHTTTHTTEAENKKQTHDTPIDQCRFKHSCEEEEEEEREEAGDQQNTKHIR